jgi:glycosyltransferase involved in cell wall biosynthesis
MNPEKRTYSICVVTQQVNNIISGIGLHARNLISHMQRDGHRVWVIAPEAEKPAGKLDYSFTGVTAPIFGKSQARWISLSWSFHNALEKLLQIEKLDLIHFTDGRESMFSRPTIPMVGNVNDTYAADLQPLGYYRKNYRDWLTRWAYYCFVHQCEIRLLPRLDAVIANSQYTSNVISSQYHLDPSKLFTIHKSIELNQFLKVREMKKKSSPDTNVILFVGGNMQRKGLPALIRAAPHVLKVVPDAQFWVVGQDRAEPAMKDLCQQSGVLDDFHFLGRKNQEELQKIYAETTLFCLPSLVEAFGVVYIEAMAAGLPVIGTTNGGASEIINDGENGLLVAPDHPQMLAEALIKLLSDLPLRERFVKKGVETAQTFSVDNMMAETYKIYDRLTSKNLS